MEHVYGTLELRSTNDELREFDGIANTCLEDDHGTIIEPSGARFSLPMPLLFQHDQSTPVGEITEARLIDGKWHVKGTIRKVDEPGFVKDITDRAWHNVKHKLMRGLSIGFKPLKQQANRFLVWAWRELSIVTLPSNSDCSIIAVRSAFVAASGDTKSSSPGVSGTPNPKRQPKMTIQEQVTQYENTRAAKVAARDSLMDKASSEGRTLDETESESFDNLDAEVRSIDDHLTRLNSVRLDTEKRAVPVNGATSSSTASDIRGGAVVRTPHITVRPNTIPGLGFARYVMSLVAARGNRYEAAEYARQAFGDSGEEIAVMHRAAVAPGTTVQATFAAPLVTTNYINEFLELLRPATLLGRIPGLRHVPFNTSMPAQTAGGTYKWVGQGKMKPVTNAQYASVTLGFAKASGIIVLTEELVKLSTPSAQEAVRDEMIKGIQQFLDGQFVDATVAAVANVNPASITNGVAGTAASGTTGAAARTDVAARVAAFAAANYNLGGLVVLMSQSTAFTLGLAIHATTGEPAFPNLGINGGSLLGIPVVTSEAVGAQIIFVHAPSILIADEGGIEIDVSREASLQLDSVPTDPPDATTVLTSLWQANLVGLRVERYITWGKARSTAVDRITGVAYVA